MARKNTKEKLTAPEKLKLLFTIVDRRKTEFFVDLLDSFDISLQAVTYGRGTAPLDFKHIGLGDEEKAVIMSIVKEDKLKEILSAIEERFQKTKFGKGIAYTIPLTSVIGVLVYQFLANKKGE